MSDATFDRSTAQLDLIEKLLKIANLQADTTLKITQQRFAPWQLVLAAFTAGAAVAGAFVAVGHWL